MSYGESTTTTGELSYGDDNDWVFDLVFPFWYRVCIGGFFFVFFGTELRNTVYCFCLLVCFDFALIVIFRLSQYLRD